MTDRLNEATADDPTTPEGVAAADRRSLLTKGGAAAAVAAVAGLGISRRASAYDGQTIMVGASHAGTSTTRLYDGTTLRVDNGESAGDSSIYGFQDGTAADGAYGVHGQHTGTDGTGVYGQASGSGGRGVRGRSVGSAGVGVYGIHDSDTATGTGVIGESGRGSGVIGRGSSLDLVADSSGRVRLSSVGQSGSESDSGSIGTIARDAVGNLWYCTDTDTWQILAGPDAPAPEIPDTSGTFVAIDPVRVFDSRQEAYPGSGLLAPNEERTLPVSDGRDLTGVVTTPDAVPAGATAIAYNVTVTGTTGPNFVSVVPGDAAGYTTSSINWSTADQSVANGSIVRVDASRQVKIFGGDQTGSAHVILDVTGYFT